MSGEQIQVLTHFATDLACGEEPNDLCLKMAIHSARDDLGDKERQSLLIKLSSHPIIHKIPPNNKWSFRQEQMAFC